MDALTGLAQSFTAKEKEEANQISAKIAQVAGAIKAQKEEIESNFVRLSQLIDEVRAKKYWLLGEYKTFGDYLADCEKKYGIKHSQLYVGMKVARNLLPSVTEKDLVGMGISKAGVLSKYVEQSGNSVIPNDILDIANDPKVRTEDLDAAVNGKLHNVLSTEKSKWYNPEGFYVTEEELKELQDAENLARSIDPVVSNSIPGWQQRKEIALRLAQEFIAAWSGGGS